MSSRSKSKIPSGKKSANKGSVEQISNERAHPSPDGSAERANSRSNRSAGSIAFTTILRIGFFCFLWYFWTVKYRSFIYISQEYDLFLWRPDFFMEAASRVAGLGEYVSSFFIQFCYYPVLGGAILAFFGALIQYWTERIFRLDGYSRFLSFFPSCLLPFQITIANYFIFEGIDVAYLYSFTFNYAFVLTFVGIYEQIRSPRVRSIVFIATVAIAYPIFGFFALFAALLCLLKEFAKPDDETWSDASSDSTSLHLEDSRSDATSEIPNADVSLPSKGKKNNPDQKDIRSKRVQKQARNRGDKKSNRKLQRLELLCAFTLLTPAMFWPFYRNAATSFQATYVAGLWEQTPLAEGREASTHFMLTVSVLSLILFFLLVSLATAVREKYFGAARSSKREDRKRVGVVKSVVTLIGSFCLCCLVSKYSFSEPNYLATLKTAANLDQENWTAIIEEESTLYAPTYPMINARNLALQRVGIFGDRAFSRTPPISTSPQLETITSFAIFGDRILFEYGLVNAAERAAFNNYVAKNRRSYWALKTLALCAVADERYNLSKRYLCRIQGTLFHREFADELLDYVDAQNKTRTPFDKYVVPHKKASEKRLSEIAERFEKLRALFPLRDELASTESINQIIYGFVLKDEIDMRPLPEQENRLTILLVESRVPQFAERFAELLDGYLIQKQGEPLPRHIQEAALLREQFPGFFTPKTPDVKWTIPSSVTLDPEIRAKFERFINLANHGAQPNYNNPKDAFVAEFGNTYWLYFCFPRPFAHYY